MAYDGDPEKAIELYVGNEYIQHNPDVEDGKKTLLSILLECKNDYKDKNIQFLRSVAERDLVALHTYQKWPNDEEFVTMDFFKQKCLIMPVKLLNIGIQSKKYPKLLNIIIRCCSFNLFFF